LNPYKILIFFLLSLILNATGNQVFAQQAKTDSVRMARQRTLDSTKNQLKQRTDSLAAIRKYKESKRYKDSVAHARNAGINAIKETRARHFDSVNTERKRVLDSAIAARKANTEQIQQRMKTRTDSLAEIRKYKESKRYKDSVLRSRNARLDSMRNTRTQYFDSVKAVRQHILDSSITARKKVSDSIRIKQKVKTDSLARIRKYKESRRYRDSVQVTRQSRLDSIKAVRKIYSDNIISVRKKTLDSLTKSRKVRMDSLVKVRKIRTDSLDAMRQVRADSLAKKKELREKEQKAEQKRKEEKMKLALDIKIKKKHEAWSNEKMLKKKWTPVRQVFQNTFTRYNYYFNAHHKMEEAHANMERRKKDNFEDKIDLFPFDPNKDSTVFASDMDTIIRKASIGIQIHDPRTKWADDLYLLMGQSYYYKGDYERATATFKYIIGMRNRNLTKKKKKNAKTSNELVQKEKSRIGRLLQHKPAHNDAILWLTRTNTDSHKEADAEAILDLLDASSRLSSNMKSKIALERANLHIKKGEYREASKQLSFVTGSKAISKYTRQRASFLNGQLLYAMGQYDSAALQYKKNIALHPPIEMDFYARKNRAAAIAESGGDQSQSIASLKKLLRDGKYSPYYEQVYFILGKLSANDGRTEEALANYNSSLRQPKTTRKQKAITFAAMGNIQYKLGRYNLAKKAYDSASYFAKGITDNEELNIALKRGKSLDKIELPYIIIQTNDSLLKLAAMSEKDQRAVARRYLKYLEKQKQDSITNAALAASSGSLGTPGSTPSGSGTSSWYFSNPVAVQQGYNEFKRKWGNRPLADNWRRASTFSFGITANEADTTAEETAPEEITENSLVAAIPKTEADLDKIRKGLRRAYVDLGGAYIKDLEEFKEGLATLDTLENRYPGHEYPDEVLSLRYTAALRQGKLDEAEQIRVLLLNSFPESSFAKTLNSDVKTETGTTANANISEYYEETYQLAIDRQYESVLQRTAVAKRSYGDQSYIRKFTLLEAMSFAATGQYKKADTLLVNYIKENPSDSLRAWVDAIQKNVAEQKAADTLKTADTSKTMALNSSALSKADSSKTSVLSTVDTSAARKIIVPDQYTYAPKEVHYCIFLFGKPDAKTAGFRSGLADFSTIKFSAQTINTGIEMLNTDQSMIVSKPFSNASLAKAFMNAAKNENLLFREMDKGSYQYFIVSEKNFIRLKAEKKTENYLPFYRKNYK
jgi:hypothetical protein